MAFFTSAYKLLAHLAPNWDTQLRTDMQSLEDNLFEATWTPGFGGTGASLGSGTGTGNNGFVSRKGTRMTYWGAVGFGSGASWGTGTPVLTNFNISGNLGGIFVGGSGRLVRAGGGITNLFMSPAYFPSGSIISPTVASTGALLTSLSAPGANDQLIFTVDAILA